MKKFSFTGTYPNCVSFAGSNGDILTLEAAPYCNAGLYNVTLHVTMAENTSNSIVSNFQSTVILVTSTSITDTNRIYTLGTQSTTLTFDELLIKNGTQETYTPKNVSYSVFWTQSNTELVPPLFCPELLLNGTLQ